MIAAFFQWSFFVAIEPMPACHWTPSSVEAEEVRRLHRGRGVPRAGGAVDERLRRMLLRIVGDRDRLVTRERADHDVGAELLHEPLGLLDRRVGRVVGAADADELQRMPADRASVPARGGLVLVVRLRAAELRDRGDRSADVLLVVRGERAAAVGHDRDLDRRRRRLADGRRRRRRCHDRDAGHRQHERQSEATSGQFRVDHQRPPRVRPGLT